MQTTEISKSEENFFKHMPCPMCKSEKSESIYPIDKAYASFHSSLDLSNVSIGVVQCKACDHQFIQPMPQPPFLKAFYSSYMSKAKDGFYRERFLDKIPCAFHERYGRWLERISLLHKSGGALLDIGSGLGMFIRLAKEYGFTVAGVEPNSEAAKVFKEHYVLKGYNCMLEELDISAQYDVVTMWDLLEHLPDPHVAIQKVHDVLNKGGLLVLESPVRDSFIHWLVKGAYKASFRRIKRPLLLVYGIHHLQYFSEKSIRSFLTHNGFEIINIYRRETDIQALISNRSRYHKLLYACMIHSIFLLSKILRKQNKVVIFARKSENKL